MKQDWEGYSFPNTNIHCPFCHGVIMSSPSGPNLSSSSKTLSFWKSSHLSGGDFVFKALLSQHPRVLCCVPGDDPGSTGEVTCPCIWMCVSEMVRDLVHLCTRVLAIATSSFHPQRSCPNTSSCRPPCQSEIFPFLFLFFCFILPILFVTVDLASNCGIKHPSAVRETLRPRLGGAFDILLPGICHPSGSNKRL